MNDDGGSGTGMLRRDFSGNNFAQEYDHTAGSGAVDHGAIALYPLYSPLSGALPGELQPSSDGILPRPRSGLPLLL